MTPTVNQIVNMNMNLVSKIMTFRPRLHPLQTVPTCHELVVLDGVLEDATGEIRRYCSGYCYAFCGRYAFLYICSAFGMLYLLLWYFCHVSLKIFSWRYLIFIWEVGRTIGLLVFSISYLLLADREEYSCNCMVVRRWFANRFCLYVSNCLKECL